MVSAGLIRGKHCIIKLRGVNLINYEFINLSNVYCLPVSSEELLCPINSKDGVDKINPIVLNISLARPPKD